MLMVTPRTNALLTHQIKIDKKNKLKQTGTHLHQYRNEIIKSFSHFTFSRFYLDNVAEIAKS